MLVKFDFDFHNINFKKMIWYCMCIKSLIKESYIEKGNNSYLFIMIIYLIHLSFIWIRLSFTLGFIYCSYLNVLFNLVTWVFLFLQVTWVYIFFSYLEDNEITGIPDGSLAGQTNLQIFSMYNNKLTEITATTFTSATNLQTL